MQGHTNRQLRTAAVVITLALAACGAGAEAASTTSTPATTTTAPTTTTTLATTTTTIATTTTLSQEELDALALEADTPLILALWRGYSDAWFRGVDAAWEYVAANSHPIVQCTAEEFTSYYNWPEESSDEVVVNADTIARDGTWTVPSGTAVGQVPEGRVYIMQAQITTGISGEETINALSEIHTAILDGRAYMFYACED